MPDSATAPHVRLAAAAVIVAAVATTATCAPAVTIDRAAAPAVSGTAPLALPAVRPQPPKRPHADARIAATDAALDALAPTVRRMSHPEALRTAFQAYYNYRTANPDAVRKPYLYFVDFGLDNATARGYVFDMELLMVVDGPFTVAHGRGSSVGRNGVPTTFSNRSGSYQTSLGLYLAEETYTFRGRANGGAYSSVGLRMRGESGRFNSAARSRGIVAHGAPYVTPSDAGRSEGCPAMEPSRADRLLPMIANGGVVFHYSPHDVNWLTSDPWVRNAD
ncbi:hypothetical protein BH23GEM10_BH23GEM10_17160 [soil metagenome]